VTGRAPFVGRNPIEVMTAHVTSPVPVPSHHAPQAGISRELDEAIERGLQKSPGRRYASADEFRAALLVAAGESPDARRRLRTHAGPLPLDPALARTLKTSAEPSGSSPDDPGFEGRTLAASTSSPKLRPQQTGVPVRFGPEGGAVAEEAHANAVTSTGMFVRTTRPLPERTRAVVEALLPGDPEPLRAVVRVLFVVQAGASGEPGMGVEFVQLDEAGRARIERAARRRTR